MSEETKAEETVVEESKDILATPTKGTPEETLCKIGEHDWCINNFAKFGVWFVCNKCGSKRKPSYVNEIEGIVLTLNNKLLESQELIIKEEGKYNDLASWLTANYPEILHRYNYAKSNQIPNKWDIVKSLAPGYGGWGGQYLTVSNIVWDDEDKEPRIELYGMRRQGTEQAMYTITLSKFIKDFIGTDAITESVKPESITTETTKTEENVNNGIND
jgi:hypothetical protein